MADNKRLENLRSARPVSLKFPAATILAAIMLFIWGCAAHNTTKTAKDSDRKTPPEISFEKTSFSQSRTEDAFNLFPKYRIAPGDVLDVLFQISTWGKKETFTLAVDNTVAVKFPNAPELNEEQMIRPDGTISLPYIGEQYVLGKTVVELTSDLKTAYSKILQDPELYVTVPDFRFGIKELKADLHTAPRGLSRLVTVRPDGYVTFPMVGEMLVANKTIADVNKALNDKYAATMAGLHVDLFLEKHSGSMIYVVGAVTKPGTYPIARPITVLEALTLAGSYTPGAKLESIIVVRKHETKLIATRINLADTLDLKEDSRFFYLQPDDIIYVPRTWISRAADVARDLADIMFFRGWNLGFSWELHREGPSY